MQLKKVSLFIIFICVFIGSICPQSRDLIRALSSFYENKAWSFSEQQLKQSLISGPRDIYSELAIIQYARREPASAYSRIARLRQIAEQYPHEPAGHLAFALQLLALQYKQVSQPDNPHSEEYLELATRHLQAAAALSGENAAPEFLLAYTHLVKGDTASAENSLKRALTKPGWSLYSRETQRAFIGLAERAGVSKILVPDMMLNLEQSAHLNSSNDQVVRVMAILLAQIAADNRLHNFHSKALFYYQSVLWLGNVIVRDAGTAKEGMFGQAILLLPAQNFAIPQRAYRFNPGFFQNKKTQEQVYAANNKVFQTYLLTLHRPDLADRFLDNLSYANGFVDNALSAQSHEQERLSRAIASPTMFYLTISWVQFSVSFGLLLLVGLFARWLNRCPPQRLIPEWKWHELLYILFGIFVIMQIIFPSVYQHYCDPSEMMLNIIPATFPIVLISTILFVLIPILRAYTRSRMLPFTSLREYCSACITSLYTLLMPSTAILLVVALLLTMSVHLSLQQRSDRYKQSIEEGRTQYLQQSVPLGLDTVAKASPGI